MQLRDHLGRLEEGRAHNLFCGLIDYEFARRLLRISGPKGRGRFAEHGWAYGDPSYTYETDPFEVFVFQARVVADVLFSGRLRCQLFFYSCEDEAMGEFLSSLVDGEGFPADLAEDYPHITGAYADFAVLIAEITGDAEAIWRLKGALARRDERCLYYDPESEIGANEDPSRHLLMLYDSELYPEREIIHDMLFEALIRAKGDIGDALGD